MTISIDQVLTILERRGQTRRSSANGKMRPRVNIPEKDRLAAAMEILIADEYDALIAEIRELLSPL
jgi:hypothetical protein